MAVDRCTIHHQGGGAPTDNSSGYSYGGYSYGIGKTKWERFRSPQDSWATLNYNHVSLDICLSGSRGNTDPAYPVTDNDIALIHGAFMDCYNRGEVVGSPQVVAHRNSPGSSTACPGDHTMARWDDVSNAVKTQPQPQPPKDDEMDLSNAINKDGRPTIFQVGGDGKLYNRTRAMDTVSWGAWNDLSGGKSGFVTVTAFVNPGDSRLVVWATMSDGKTLQRSQNSAGSAEWGSWSDMTR
jgi:hypothetical protein